MGRARCEVTLATGVGDRGPHRPRSSSQCPELARLDADRDGARVPAGLLAFVAGYGLFLRATPGEPYVEFLLPTMLLLGIGFGLCFAALNAQATGGVADHEQGLASGLLNTSLQVGGAVVLAVVTAILGDGTAAPHHQLLPHTHTALALVIGVSSAAALFTLVHLYRTREVLFAATA